MSEFPADDKAEPRLLFYCLFREVGYRQGAVKGMRTSAL